MSNIFETTLKIGMALAIGSIAFFTTLAIALVVPKSEWWLAAAVGTLSFEIALRRIFSSNPKDDDPDSYLDPVEPNSSDNVGWSQEASTDEVHFLLPISNCLSTPTERG